RFTTTQLQRDRVLHRVQRQQPPTIAVDDGVGVHHLGVQPRMRRQQPVEDPAVGVGPVHHRGDGQAQLVGSDDGGAGHRRNCTGRPRRAGPVSALGISRRARCPCRCRCCCRCRCRCRYSRGPCRHCLCCRCHCCRRYPCCRGCHCRCLCRCCHGPCRHCRRWRFRFHFRGWHWRCRGGRRCRDRRCRHCPGRHHRRGASCGRPDPRG